MGFGLFIIKEQKVTLQCFSLKAKSAAEYIETIPDWLQLRLKLCDLKYKCRFVLQETPATKQ